MSSVVAGSRQRDRAALGAHLRLAVVSAATAWAAMWSWRGFTDESSTFLVQLIIVAAAVAVTGAVARWRRWPGIAVLAVQLLVGGAVTCQLVASWPLPGDRFWAAISGAVDAANIYAAPVPVTDGVSVQPLLVLGGFVAIVLVDLCAATLRRVPLAGLPLLTVYSVPISLIDRGLAWWVFAATAVGFLVLLYLQEEEHLARWGRTLETRGKRDQARRRLSDSVRVSAIAVGSIATAAAVVVPLAVPTLSLSFFDVGPGSGDDGDIQVTNPLVDLRQDLVRGEDIPLLTVRTDDPSPDHLRISVLNRYTTDEWSAGDRKVPTENLAQGELPLPVGVDRSIVTDSPADYQVEVTDEFVSRWLPTQAPISAISAEGDWRFDETTMDFLASDDDLDTAGASYSFTASLPQYDQDALLRLDTSGAAVADELTDLPYVPTSVSSLARQVTSGATTDFERAVLLNQFFRKPGNFTYQIPEDADGGVTTSELADFLDPNVEGGRTGYCEQFSAAMAVMARLLDIPARVAVGFLEPSRVEGTDDTWVYSAHDLHAWVELYFPRAGWVLFDPTPAGQPATRALPDYANADVDSDPIDIPTGPTESSETRPTQQVPTEDPQTQPAQPEAPTAAPEGAGSGSSFPWLTILVVVAGLAIVVLLLLLPRTLRRRQRERRLAGGPESAWEELRATAVDLRLPWPEGRSPHETRDLVATWFGAAGDHDQRPARGGDRDPEAVRALVRLVIHLERHRYARQHHVDAGTLRDDVLRCCDALVAGATPRTRRRATWLPRSVTQRRQVVDGAPQAEPELVGARSEVL